MSIVQHHLHLKPLLRKWRIHDRCDHVPTFLRCTQFSCIFFRMHLCICYRGINKWNERCFTFTLTFQVHTHATRVRLTTKMKYLKTLKWHAKPCKYVCTSGGELRGADAFLFILQDAERGKKLQSKNHPKVKKEKEMRLLSRRQAINKTIESTQSSSKQAQDGEWNKGECIAKRVKIEKWLWQTRLLCRARGRSNWGPPVPC